MDWADPILLPLEKALSRIAVGKPLPQHGPHAFDYTHILTPEQQEAIGPKGTLIVHGAPPSDKSKWPRAHAMIRLDNGEMGGEAYGFMDQSRGEIRPFHLEFSEARGVPREHNGQRTYLGRVMYEALLAHVKNHMGATHVIGGTHSTYASKAHAALAEKHGLGYEPVPNVEGEQVAHPLAGEEHWHNPFEDMEDWDNAPESFDDRFAPYAYTLKAECTCKEEPLEKAAKSFAKVKEGERISHPGTHQQQEVVPVEHYDYSHLLPKGAEDDYKIVVRDSGRGFLHAGIRYGNHEGPLVGKVYGKISPAGKEKGLEIGFARVDPQHRGQKIGLAAYEALIAHAFHFYKARHVIGDLHSSTAHATHMALANKYGLNFEARKIDYPSGTPGEQERGSFDAAYGDYAYTIKSSVTEGDFPKLAKEEGDDPIMDFFTQPDWIRPSEVSLRLMEDGIRPEHIKALFDHNHASGVIDAIWKHPLFTKDLFNQILVDEDGALKDEDNRVITGLPIELPADHWTNQDPGHIPQVLNKAIEKHSVKREGEGRYERLARMRQVDVLKGRLGGYLEERPHNLAPAPGDNTQWDGVPRWSYPGVAKHVEFSTKEAFERRMFKDVVKHISENPEAPYATQFKDKVLEHVKGLCSSAERMKRDYGNAHSRMKGALEAALPLVSQWAKEGKISNAFIKKHTTKKGLFTAILSQAPNFPKKKFDGLLAHFQNDEKMAHRLRIVRKTIVGSLMNSPHLGPEEWKTLVSSPWGSGSGVDPAELVKDPRMDDNLLKLIFNKNPSEDFVDAMKDAGKLTPQFVHELVQSSHAASDALITGDTEMVDKVRLMDVDEGVKDLFDKADNLLPETLNEIKNRAQATLKYRVDNDLLGGKYSRDRSSDFLLSVAAHKAATPEIKNEIAKTMATVQRDDSGLVESLLASPGITEDTIQHVLQNSFQLGHFSAVLGREDAKPGWIDTVLARPEMNEGTAVNLLHPETGEPSAEFEPRVKHIRPETRYYNHSQANDYRDLLESLREGVRGQIARSPGLGPERLGQMLQTTKDRAEAEALTENPNFGPEHVAWMLDDARAPQDPAHEFSESKELPPGVWNVTDRTGLLGNLLNHKGGMLTPEQWSGLTNRGLKELKENARPGLLAAVINDSHVTADALRTIYHWNLENQGKDNTGIDWTEKILSHSNVDPAMVDYHIRNYEPDVALYASLLEKPNLAPESVQAMMTRLNEGGKGLDLGAMLTNYRGAEIGGNPFWRDLAFSPHAPLEWLTEVHKQLADGDFLASHSSHAFVKNIVSAAVAHNPDGVYPDKVAVRVGGHKWRGLRDLVEQSGEPEVEVKKLPPGDYSKVRTKNPRKATVSPQSIQDFIDKLPATNLNASFSTWRGCQVHDGGQSKVFQVNVSNEQVKQMKEAGVFGTFRKLQAYIGGHHPITPATVGWVRFSGDPETGSVHVDEVQSDHRQTMADMARAHHLQYNNRDEAGAQRAWEEKNEQYPHAHQKKISEIIFGKAQPHEVLLEAFHEYLRGKGMPATMIHFPGLHFRGALSGLDGFPRGWSKENPEHKPPVTGKPPVHYVETYEKMPKRMGYNLEGAKYGDEKTETDDSTYFGMPMHTSPVRKFEEPLDKMAVGELPPAQPIKETRDSRVFDASHLLTPEHRNAGYSMRIVTGRMPIAGGGYITADVKHHDQFVGGVTANVGDQYILGHDPKNPRRDVSFDLADIQDEHSGKGLGMAMYEAIIAHAKKHHGATHVRGIQHSSLASRVHQKLAEKHGMSYTPEPNFPSQKYPTEEAWKRPVNPRYDTKYRPYVYTIKSEGPLAKALRGQGVPAGVEVGPHTLYDYTHMLPEKIRSHYRMALVHKPGGSIQVVAVHNATGKRVGEITAQHTPEDREVSALDTYVDPEHREQGLGLAMYEALYSHGVNALGATHASGKGHSTGARGVHTALAAKHGLKYQANPNIRNMPGHWAGSYTPEEWANREPSSYDLKYGKYKYTLR